MTKKEMQLPQLGDRVGFVCGPGQFPRDNAGTVTRVYSNRWYANNAEVQMDNGSVEHIVGAYTTVGIGAHLIRRKPDLEAMEQMLRKTHPGFQQKIAAIAQVAGQSDVQVYVLWKEYQDKCGDQSALLFEFVQWYRSELGGNIEALIAATEGA